MKFPHPYIWSMLGPCWVIWFLEGKNNPHRKLFGWGSFWGQLKGPKGYVGPMLGRFGSMLGPCWIIWWGSMGFHGGFWGEGTWPHHKDPNDAVVSWKPLTFDVGVVFSLGISFLYHFLASISGAICIGWVSIKFEVFYGVFPSYRGLIWCSSGLAGGSFHDIEG